MDDRASLSTLSLPVVNLSQKAEEGFLGVGHVAVRGPAQELEVTHHELALLQLQSRRSGERGKKKWGGFLKKPFEQYIPWTVLWTPCTCSTLHKLIKTCIWLSARGHSVDTSALLQFNGDASALSLDYRRCGALQCTVTGHVKMSYDQNECKFADKTRWLRHCIFNQAAPTDTLMTPIVFWNAKYILKHEVEVLKLYFSPENPVCGI